MGTDIHGGFIKYENGVKTPIKTNWEMERDYTLFAILAGVRNGYGFAGCYRHEPLDPIAQGRGLPDWLDFDAEDYNNYTKDLYNKWFGTKYADPEEKEFGTWLGDHSYTYMTVNEILSWSGWDGFVKRGGVLEKDHYDETLAVDKDPEHWRGGIGGGSINVVDEDVYKTLNTPYYDGKEITHIKASWTDKTPLKEYYSWFIDEVTRIKTEYGDDVYLIVGFDS
jgi:hypothetical protein